MDADAAKGELIGRRVLHGVVGNYAAKVVALGTGFFLTPFILHQLGATGYGLLALVGSVVAYGSFLELGIAGAVIKYVAEYRVRGETGRAHSLIATTLCLYCALGLVVIACSAAVALVFPHFFNVPRGERATTSWLVVLMGAGIGISIPCTTASAVLRGLQRYDIGNLIGIGGTLLSTAATVAVLLLHGGLLGLVAVNVAVTLVMQVPSVWSINRVAPELHFGWRGARRSMVRTILSFSASLFVVRVGSQLQSKTDEIVIGTFLPISAVTPFAIARRLGEIAQLLTDQFMKVLLPLASELHAENDQARLRLLYITSTRLTLAIFVPIGCTFVLLARAILTVWVGAAYADAAPLVTILTIASFIDTSQWPAGSVLQGMARHRPLAFMALGSGVANVILSAVLVHRLGLTGVALGTLIPTAVECLCIVLPYAMRTLDVGAATLLKDIVAPTLLPLGPMVVVVYVLEHAVKPASLIPLAVVSGVGVLVYLIGYLTVGAGEVERRTCRSVALSTIHLAKAGIKRP